MLLCPVQLICFEYLDILLENSSCSILSGENSLTNSVHCLTNSAIQTIGVSNAMSKISAMIMEKHIILDLSAHILAENGI
jgi:hypothetical protein